MTNSARRSERVQNKKMPDYAKDTTPVVEGTKAQRRQKGTTKRRKREDTATFQTSVQVAKPGGAPIKGRRGRLKFITEVPLDILHEIFRELEPLDLVHLSWVNKSLRAIVMGNSARYIWTELFEKLFASTNPPPKCPDDLNLAQYAHLLFTKKCMVCYTATKIWTCWVLRLRVCLDCLLSSERFKPMACLYNCVPVICAEDQRFCLAQDYHENGQCRTIRTNTRTYYLRSSSENHYYLERWEENRIKEKEEQLEKLRIERRATIISKLAEIGWTLSEIQEITNWRTNKLPGFMKTAKLTDKEWDTLQPLLENRLQKLKKASIDHKRRLKIPLRWRAFETQFSRWKEEQTRHPSLIPSAIDLAFCEPFKSAIFVPNDSVDVEASLEDFARADKEWTETRSKIIRSMLPEDYSAQVLMDGVLQPPLLAVLMFRRSEFGIGVRYTIDELYGHRAPSLSRHRPPVDCVSSNDLAMFSSIKKSTGRRPWLWDYKAFQFDLTAHKLSAETLRVLGLDPRTTTISRMGEYKEGFKCTLCGEADRVNWSMMIKHELIWHRGERKKSIPAGAGWELKVETTG